MPQAGDMLSRPDTVPVVDRLAASDDNTLWRFYRKHRLDMRKLFGHTVRTAVTMGLVELAVQAVDGAKVVANASRDKDL